MSTYKITIMVAVDESEHDKSVNVKELLASRLENSIDHSSNFDDVTVGSISVINFDGGS